VVNDGSTDNTEEVVKSFSDKRIKYIWHEKNKGAAAARNTGIKIAKGEYIAFQDSDDEWLPEKLEKQIMIFEKALPEVGIVYSDMWRISRNGKRRYWHSPSIMPENGIVYKKALDYGLLNLGIQSAIIKRECFDKAGMFDEKLPRLIDLEFFIALSRYFYFCHIEEPLVIFYETGEGISSCDKADLIAHKLILKKYFEDIKKDRRLLARHYYSIGSLLCLNGEVKIGRSYLIKAIMAYPLNVKFLLVALISLFGQGSYNRVAESYRKIRGW